MYKYSILVLLLASAFAEETQTEKASTETTTTSEPKDIKTRFNVKEDSTKTNLNTSPLIARWNSPFDAQWNFQAAADWNSPWTAQWNTAIPPQSSQLNSTSNKKKNVPVATFWNLPLWGTASTDELRYPYEYQHEIQPSVFSVGFSGFYGPQALNYQPYVFGDIPVYPSSPVHDLPYNSHYKANNEKKKKTQT